jgi:hypothetical protein
MRCLRNCCQLPALYYTLSTKPKFHVTFANIYHTLYVLSIFQCGSFRVVVTIKPNVVVEWEVPGSNFGPETGYPDSKCFVVFLSPSKRIPG